MKRKRTDPSKSKAQRPPTSWLNASHPQRGFSMGHFDLEEPSYRVVFGKNRKGSRPA